MMISAGAQYELTESMRYILFTLKTLVDFTGVDHVHLLFNILAHYDRPSHYP